MGSFLPFDEQIGVGEYRDRALIESAAGRPFQTAFGSDVWPSISEKAAALFHSLACNHCFFNGNKRTAVIALDLFLVMNGHILTMTSEVYKLFKATAKANHEGIPLSTVMEDLRSRIEESAVSMRVLDGLVDRGELNTDKLRRVLQHVSRLKELVHRVVSITPPL